MALKQAQKFTKEELSTLQDIQSRTQTVTLQLGQLYLNKIRLEEQENNTKAHIKKLEEEEAKIAQQLSNKYGKGSINLETGEFTPTE